MQKYSLLPIAFCYHFTNLLCDLVKLLGYVVSPMCAVVVAVSQDDL